MLVAALALVAALQQLPVSARTVHARVGENAELSNLERELAPTRAYGLNPSLILRAAEVLPRDAVFHVAVGEGMVSGHEAAAPFAAYWLLPRRHTLEPRRAGWILSHGAAVDQLGVPVEVVEDLGQGLRLLRVRR